jgi:agmatinase
VPGEDGPRYAPPDARDSPRYAGVKTFARCPLASDPGGVDVAVLGIPFDTATTNRPGARFGPEAIRSASIALRPYNPAQQAQVFGRLSVADLGDAPVTPGNAERTVARIAEHLEPIVRSGARTLCLGGDHLVVLGELRAIAAVHGPVGVVLLDAHADVWDVYCGERYYHGSPFRRALEEGIVDPGRSFLAGMRGGVYSAEDADVPRELGFEVLTCEDLVALSYEEYAARVRERVGSGDPGPLFLSFDVDVLDPAFAPGTGTPEVGGLGTREALGYLRALRGLAFAGYDVVEVSPPYDGPGQQTAVAAANVAFELLTLDVLAQGDAV